MWWEFSRFSLRNCSKYLKNILEQTPNKESPRGQVWLMISHLHPHMKTIQWHHMLAHFNISSMKEIQNKKGTIIPILSDFTQLPLCESCIMEKIARIYFHPFQMRPHFMPFLIWCISTYVAPWKLFTWGCQIFYFFHWWFLDTPMFIILNINMRPWWKNKMIKSSKFYTPTMGGSIFPLHLKHLVLLKGFCTNLQYHTHLNKMILLNGKNKPLSKLQEYASNCSIIQIILGKSYFYHLLHSKPNPHINYKRYHPLWNLKTP